MGSPKLIKALIYLALLAGAAWAGVNYLRENPNSADIRRIQPPAYQLPGPQNPYPK